MAKFLTTTEITSELEKIIRDANEQLIIMSPYLKVNQRLKDLLEDKNRFKDVDIRVVYGKNELRPEENNWLEALTSIRTSFRQHLHAKCYINEDKALVSSMNLYEFSQQNNDEMGFLVLRDEEPELYQDVKNEVMRILRGSDEVRVTVAMVESSREDTPELPKPKAASTIVKAPESGVCIRCGDSIAANAGRPYCGDHYRSWNRYKNLEWEEKYCHTCGKEQTATMAKPLCLVCYRKFKKWVDSTTEQPSLR